MNNFIEIKIVDKSYRFEEIGFDISKRNIKDTFLRYGADKSVDHLLTKKHYQSLTSDIKCRYSAFRDKTIQEFIEYLLASKDVFYKNFLNANGEDTFCEFSLVKDARLSQHGLYFWKHEEKIKYIGRVLDNFGKRFGSNGYGKISPINCYKEGQSTNTRINSLMNRFGDSITIYLCPIESDYETKNIEKNLIKKYKPEWNKQH